jgi:hypothetical protein
MASREHSLRARLAHEHRRRDRDPERILDLRRQLAAQRIEDFIKRVQSAAPPLTAEQCHRLMALLGGEADAAA